MGIWDWFTSEEDPALDEKRARALEALTQARNPVFDQSQVPMNAYRRYRATQGDTNVNPAVARAEGAIVSALPRVVTAPTEVFNFFKQLYDYNANTETTDEEGQPRAWQDRWSAAQYGGDDPAVKVVDEKVRLVKERIAKGDARPPNKIFDEVEESPEFKAIKEANLPVVRRYTDKVANAIDYVAGSPKDEDKTTGEKILNIGTQALFPATLVDKGLKLAKVPGAVRTAADLLVTPGTSNYTKGGIAANAAVGAGIVGGLDAALGNPNNDKPLAPEINPNLPTNPPLPPPRPKRNLASIPIHEDTKPEASALGTALNSIPGLKEATTAAVAAAAMLITPRYVKTFAKQMNMTEEAATEYLQRAAKAEEASKKTGGAFTSAGAAKQDPLERKPGIVRRTFDEHAPTQDFLEAVTKDRKIAQDAVTRATIHGGSNQTAILEQWKQAGFQPGTTKTTIPLRQFVEREAEIDRQGLRQIHNEYLLARTVKDRRTNDIDDINRAIHDNVVAQAIKSKKGDPGAVNRLKEKLDKLVARRQSMWDDLPGTRSSASLWSNADVEMKIRAGDNVPMIRETADWYKQSYRDLMETKVRMGTISVKDAAKEQARNPNYMYLQDQELVAKGVPLKGFKRTMAKFERLLTKENPDEVKASQQILPHRSRQETDLETAVNNPISPIDALHESWESGIRYIGRENLKRSIIDAAKSMPEDNLVGNLKQYTHPQNGQTSFSAKQVGKMVQKGFNISEWTTVNRNGRIEFYQFPRDPLLAQTLQQAPSWSIPLWRNVTNAWRQGTTGTLNPGYGPIAALTNTRSFNALRPSGTVYGTDYLINKATRGWLTSGSTLADRMHDLIRTATTTWDPVSFALNAMDTMKIFMLQEGKNIANHITEGLIEDKGFFAALAKVPQGRQFVEKLGEVLTNTYANSYLPMITHHRAGDLAVMNSITTIKKEVDTFITMKMPKGFDTTGHIAAEGLNMIRYFVNSMRNSANIGYVYRNIESTRLPDGTLDWKAVEKLMDDARVIGDGNMARRPSNKYVQMAMSVSPYTGTNIRSASIRAQRMRTDPRMMAMYIAGALTPKIATEYLMSHWDQGAYQYYYHDLPTWKRIAMVILPTPETVWRTKFLGEKVPFSPDAVYQIRLNPEDWALTEMVVQGLRGIGLYGAGQQDPILKQDIGTGIDSWYEALKGSFLPIMPAPAEKIAESEYNPYGKGTSGTASRIGEENLNLTSEVPSAVNEVLSTFIGTVGSRLAEAFDSTQKVYEGSDKIFDALLAGGEELWDRTVETFPEDVGLPVKIPFTDVPLYKKGNEKIYTYNEVSKRAMATRKLMSQVLFGSDSIQPRDIDEGTLKTVTVRIRNHLTNGTLGAISKEARALEDEITRLDAQRYNPTTKKFIDYNERETAMNERRKMLNDLNRKQMTFYNEMQADVQRATGPAWKQQYGEEFSFEGWRKAIDDQRKKLKETGGTGHRRYPASRTAQ